jgi:hypothetical protein
MVHSPVPVEGLLPASVTAVNPQVLMSNLSGPALATVGIPLNEMNTSSIEAAHGAFRERPSECIRITNCT